MEFKLKIYLKDCSIKQKTYSPKFSEEPGEWLLDSPIPEEWQNAIPQFPESPRNETCRGIGILS